MTNKVELLNLRFPGDTSALADVRKRVRHLLKEQGVEDADYCNSTVLALDEAISNVIRHGYHGGDGRELILEASREQDRMVYRLLDYASPISESCLCSRDLKDIRPGGLGVYIIRQIMDKVELVPPPAGHGNALKMIRALPGQSATS